MLQSPKYAPASLFTCLLSLTLLLGCGGKDAPEAAASDPAATAVVPPPPAGAASDDTIIRNFRMTVDKARAVLAVQEAVYARAMADPSLRARMDNFHETLNENSPDLTTVAGLVWMVEQFPETVTEVRRAGLSVQDYILASQSLTSLMWYDMGRQSGQTPGYDGLASRQNVAAFDQNRAEFEAIMARLQEMAEGGEED
jgi:hypothetical protein